MSSTVSTTQKLSHRVYERSLITSSESRVSPLLDLLRCSLPPVARIQEHQLHMLSPTRLRCIHLLLEFQMLPIMLTQSSHHLLVLMTLISVWVHNRVPLQHLLRTHSCITAALRAQDSVVPDHQGFSMKQPSVVWTRSLSEPVITVP